MLTVSDVQALIVITLGDAFVLNRRVRQQLGVYSTQSGNCRRRDLPGCGRGRKCLSARESTLRTLEGETQSRPR